MHRAEKSRPAFRCILGYAVDLAKILVKYNVLRAAAQMSYYLMFSLFPLLMIIVGLVGFFHLDLSAFMDFLQRLSPILGDMDVLEEYLTYILANESAALMISGIAMAVLTSAAAFRGLIYITGEITGRPSFRGPKLYLVSTLMSLVLLLTIFFTLLTAVTGRWFLQLLAQTFHRTIVPNIWVWLRFPLILAIAYGALLALYRVSLNRDALPCCKAWPGAIGSGIALLIGTAVFSLFFSISTRYSTLYGSIAFMMVLMLWFFVCNTIIIMGNALNIVRAEHYAAAGEPTVVYRKNTRIH